MGDFAGHPFRGNQYTHGGLVQHITAADRKEGANELKRYGRENIHRLPLMLQAADRMKRAVAKGEDASRAFAAEFTATRSNHGIAKKMGLDLDVQYGDWVVGPSAGPRVPAAKELPGVSVSRGDYATAPQFKMTEKGEILSRTSSGEYKTHVPDRAGARSKRAPKGKMRGTFGPGGRIT